jgi:hypothetical protein
MAEETLPHWSEGLADPIKAHITNRGHDKEDASTAAAKLAEAHFHAQKLVGVPPEQIVRLPKDGADPAYLDAYKRMAAIGAPKDAEGYTFEGVPEATATQVRALAVKLGLPAHVASELAAGMVADQTTATARATAEKEAAVGAMQASLRAAWGSNYDVNLFKTTKVAETLGWDKGTIDAMQGLVGGDKLLNAMLGLANKMGEAEILRGGSGITQGSLSRDQALARKAEIMVQSKRQLSPKELDDALSELKNLDAIIVGPPRQW